MRWTYAPGSTELWVAVIATFFVAMAVFFGLSMAPTKARRPIIGAFTFIIGAFYVFLFLWPTPINRQEFQIPRDGVEAVSFWLADFQPRIADFSNILTAFLLGLGVFSVLRIHLTKLAKKQKDWGFSVVLLVAMILMATFGYWDFFMKQDPNLGPRLEDQANWQLPQYGFALLFDGLLQQMDAAMFSMIAFYILSAAYRAFRIRSVEATVLMASALILVLSLMGVVDYYWSEAIKGLTGGDPASILNQFRLSEIANWFRSTLQVPSLRALEFGVGLGALAMGLRLWLGLEKGGIS